MKRSNAAYFHKDTTKRSMKKIRFFPIFMYNKLDNWLSEMSLKGWHITHCSMFVFYFEYGKPLKKRYFTYAEFSRETKYSLTLQHPFLEKRYGLTPSQSKINSNKSKKYQIIEIDTRRIDVQNDIGFIELVNDRNHQYFRYSLRNFGITFLVVVSIVLLNLLLKR